MKLTTQDGRVLDLRNDYSLHAWTGTNRPNLEKAVRITLEGNHRRVEGKLNRYWKYDTALDEVVGFYETGTSRDKAAEMLREAFKSGADEFTMPQDTFEKSDAEKLDDFCEEHRLGILLYGEPGYNPAQRAECKRLARETGYWERHNQLVSDEHGDYHASLAKWLALHPDVQSPLEVTA